MKKSQDNTIATIHNVRLDSHFTITPNSSAQDPNLSWSAKGLLWYILTRPADWQIHISHLAQIYEGSKRGNKTDAIKEIIKELRNNGYVKYTKSRNSTGQWVHRYDVYPMPIKDFQKIIPEGDKPPLVKPPVVKPPIIQSTELPSTDLTVVVCQDQGPVAPSPGFKKIFIKAIEGEDIALTKEELIAQCVSWRKDWSIPEIEELYEILAKYDAPVRNFLRFCESTIENIRCRNKIKNLKIKGKKCLKKPSHPIKNSKMPSENGSEKTLENDTPSQKFPLADWKSIVPLPKKLPNL